ncbi:MAG: FAD-dependent monooxygenase [Bacteroidales bacterium]|nr:FAD-dependent monooxygenase [Bacteroidales bacterium]
MIHIEELKINLSQNETLLLALIASVLRIPADRITSYRIVKKAIDSRKKSDICFVYSVDAEVVDEKRVLKGLLKSKDARGVKQHRVRMVEDVFQNSETVRDASRHCERSEAIQRNNIVVVGAGPCGLFAALALSRAGFSPLIVERGKKVEERIADVERFFKTGILNPESNVQFGEGGAGTFSDGKLYTLINDKRSHFIYQTLVECGAPSEIVYDAKPHIGTDILRKVVVSLREKIIALGGIFRFETKLTGIHVKNNTLQSVVLNDSEEMPVSALILAIGHSARDSFQMLFDSKLNMIQKPFSVGVRIEHPASLINRSQYGNFAGHPLLPPAKYKLVAHLNNGRSVYTFCMCPGGYVVAAASEEASLTVNGMSENRQDGANSNSAVLVGVHPSDFGSAHPLAGIDFQRHIEQKTFALGGSNYHAPVQTVGDFLKDRLSVSLPSEITPTYQPGITPANLKDCFPDFVVESLKLGIVEMDRKLRGFASPTALLTASETRSSSPLRILRDEHGVASVKNIYPVGEGAGYAGGIMSSAVDGLRAAERVIWK